MEMVLERKVDLIFFGSLIKFAKLDKMHLILL